MLQAADIPEVESEIDGVTFVVRSHWLDRSGAAVDQFVEEVEAERRRGERPRREHLLVLLLLLLRRRTSEPLPAASRARVRASARRLQFSGARSTGVGGFLTFTTSADSALAEIEFMSWARVEATTVGERLQRVVDAYVEKSRTTAPETPAVPSDSGVARTPDRSTGANGGQNPTVPAPRAPSVPTPTVPGPSSDPVIEMKDDLRRVVSDPGGALSRAIVDAWAYRQYNIGVYEAAKAAGVTVLVAENPMDEHTTPFCRWVNGKIISMDRVGRQLARFRAAVEAQDREALIRSWRFISMSKKAMRDARDEIAKDRPRGARIANAEIFRRFFASVGLPPYHWRCRTRARPR